MGDHVSWRGADWALFSLNAGVNWSLSSPGWECEVLTLLRGLLRPRCRLPLGPPPKFRAEKSWDWKAPLSGYMRLDRREGSFPRPAGEWPRPRPPPRPLPPPAAESCLRPKPRPPVAPPLCWDLCPDPQPEPEKASRVGRILADPKAEAALSKPPPPAPPMTPKPTPPRWVIMSPRESL